MDKNKIKNAMIFKDMSEDEFLATLKSLNATEKKYKKDATILSVGDTTDRMGLVLEGSVTIENNDIWGNKTILSHVGKAQFFAETYALLAHEPMLVDVIANEDCSILFLNIGNLRRGTSKQESWVYKLINNLLTISAHKNLILSGRSYRQQMADYLNLDRTALSKELRKMKDEGFIEYRKNHFLLKMPGDNL